MYNVKLPSEITNCTLPFFFFLFLPFSIASSVKNACRDATLSNRRTRPALHRARLANWRIIQTSPEERDRSSIERDDFHRRTVVEKNEHARDARFPAGKLLTASTSVLPFFFSLLLFVPVRGKLEECTRSCRDEHAKFETGGTHLPNRVRD